MFILKKLLGHLGVRTEEAGEDLSEKYLEHAQALLEKYGEALQVEGSDILPESLLPAKKDEIRTALKLHLALLPVDNAKQREKLKIAYGFLATFVPDEDALAFSKGNKQIAEKCAEDQERMREEIEAFCKNLPELDTLKEKEA